MIFYFLALPKGLFWGYFDVLGFLIANPSILKVFFLRTAFPRRVWAGHSSGPAEKRQSDRDWLGISERREEMETGPKSVSGRWVRWGEMEEMRGKLQATSCFPFVSRFCNENCAWEEALAIELLSAAET